MCLILPRRSSARRSSGHSSSALETSASASWISPTSIRTVAWSSGSSAGVLFTAKIILMERDSAAWLRYIFLHEQRDVGAQLSHGVLHLGPDHREFSSGESSKGSSREGRGDPRVDRPSRRRERHGKRSHGKNYPLQQSPGETPGSTSD